MLSDYLRVPATAHLRVPTTARFWKLFVVVVISGSILTAAVLIHYALAYRAVVVRQLETRKWALPSTIYADAPLLYAGVPIDRKWVAEYLRQLNYQETDSQVLKIAQFRLSEDAVTFRGNPMFHPESPPAVTISFSGNHVRQIADAETGRALESWELDPMAITDLFGGQWEKRQIIGLGQVPAFLPQAVIAIEDRRFYKHNGIDPPAIARAVYHDLFKTGRLQGASTITQQLVKNFYLTSERSLKRKLSEALMSLILESRVSKKQIMEMYLNEVYMGQRGAMSINGVGAASQLYFHKQVRNISLPEAALLAGMIQAPNIYNPYNHTEKARERRDTVLRVMKEQGFITEAAYREAVATPVVVYSMDTRIALAPYFGDLVKNQLLDKYKPERVYNDNLRVFTTLDLRLQEIAEGALIEGLDRIDKARFRRTHEHVQGCLIAIEPSTGYIRAFVGGRSYGRSQYDRLSQASRQPGSLFKPIVYAAAIESAFHVGSPQTFTAASVLQDEPTVFEYNSISWEPRNYDGTYHGEVLLRDALSHSMNIATARLAESVGLPVVAQLARSMGLNNVKPYPSMALGTFETSPWQMAQAYTVFANQGTQTELQTLKRVTSSSGKTLESPKTRRANIIHPQTAYILTNMMETVLRSGTGAGVQKWGFTDSAAAGKTGTTDDKRDAWFVGYTPGLLCLVWTGYDDNAPLGLEGAQAALPIWATFMRQAMRYYPQSDFAVPPGVMAAVIDTKTGKLSSPLCPPGRTELFIAGTEPTQICTEADYPELSPSYVTGVQGQYDEQAPAEGGEGQYPSTELPALPPPKTVIVVHDAASPSIR